MRRSEISRLAGKFNLYVMAFSWGAITGVVASVPGLQVLYWSLLAVVGTGNLALAGWYLRSRK